MLTLRSSTLALSVLLLGACGGGETETAETGDQERTEPEQIETVDAPRDLAQLFEDEPRFSTFQSAVEAADLGSVLENDGPLTIFAPNNDAFANLPQAASVDVLLRPENRELLRRILSYHIVSQDVPSTELIGEQGSFETMGGPDLAYDGTGTVVQVGSAPQTAVVTIPDIEAENGTVHVIDAVLLPPSE